MKNYLHYAFLSFLSKPFDSILILIQLFLLLSALNVSIAEYNSRAMLYEPLKEYIESPGFLCVAATDPNEERPDLAETKLNFDRLKALGDVNLFIQKEYYDPFNSDITVIILPDDIFDKLDLPLENGSKFKSDEQGDRISVIVTPNTKGYAAGKAFNDSFGNEFEVTALFTDPTYLLRYPYDVEMSFESFYESFDKEFYEGTPTFVTSQSMAEKLNGKSKECIITNEQVCLLSFNSGVSDEQINKACRQLDEDKQIEFIKTSLIRKRSEKILSDDIKRLIPAVCAFAVIVVIGLVSCSVISAKNTMKKLVVFYCCGASKASCALITVMQMIVICLISGILTAAALAFYSDSAYSDKIGFVFRQNNIYISIGVIAASIIISAAAPIIMTYRSQPREMLINSDEE